MTEEQQLRYGDYEAPVGSLLARAKRRPLTKQEFDRLQQLLACMRMVCDTPYILDPTCRVSPKLDELENILTDLMAEAGRKVIIFSEWERMLDLVRDLAGEMGLEYAWHTGSVPQDRRRQEIRRFKSDPACRLFLSTDSGSVGLNLQAATAVVNMDLPWNPARLEQRIARAWRKHQTKPVTVVNLVCENSIEHRILHLLGQKQGLADGVLDGRGDIAAIRMPSGRAAFVERLAAMMSPPALPVSAAPAVPAVDFGRDLVDRLGEAVLLVERHQRPDGGEALLTVLGGPADEVARERRRLADGASLDGLIVEAIDRATWETMQRLAAAGLIQIVSNGETLHRSVSLGDDPAAAELAEQARRRQAASAEALAKADRKLRMATLLAEGGFGDEARGPLMDAAAFALQALAMTGDVDIDPADIGSLSAAELLEREEVAARLPPGTLAALNAASPIDKVRPAVQMLMAAVQALSARAVAV